MIAQAFASLYPQRLTHLGLLHSVYQRTEAQCLNVRERYRATRDHGPTANLESALERWFSAEYRDGHADVIDEIRAIFAAHSDDGYLKAYRLFAHAEAEMHHYPIDKGHLPGTGDNRLRRRRLDPGDVRFTMPRPAEQPAGSSTTATAIWHRWSTPPS